MSKYDHLKPCPFCDAITVALRDCVDYGLTYYYALCLRCNTAGPKKHSTLEAIDAWNTRPTDIIFNKLAKSDVPWPLMSNLSHDELQTIRRITEADMDTIQEFSKLDAVISKLNEKLDNLKNESLDTKQLRTENEALKLAVLTIANEFARRDEKVLQLGDMLSTMSSNLSNMRKAIKEISSVITISGLSAETEKLLRDARNGWQE